MKTFNLVPLELPRMMRRLLVFVVIIVIVSALATPLYGVNPGKPAYQLLKDRGLFVLRDRFQEVGMHAEVDPKSQLTVFNKTMKTLTIELTGQNGTYPLVLRPKTEHSWRIAPGDYHFEASVPGFPTLAGEIPLAAQMRYKWQIWRNELEKLPDETAPATVPDSANRDQATN